MTGTRDGRHASLQTRVHHDDESSTRGSHELAALPSTPQLPVTAARPSVSLPAARTPQQSPPTGSLSLAGTQHCFFLIPTSTPARDPLGATLILPAPPTSGPGLDERPLPGVDVLLSSLSMRAARGVRSSPQARLPKEGLRLPALSGAHCPEILPSPPCSLSSLCCPCPLQTPHALPMTPPAEHRPSFSGTETAPNTPPPRLSFPLHPHTLTTYHPAIPQQPTSPVCPNVCPRCVSATVRRRKKKVALCTFYLFLILILILLFLFLIPLTLLIPLPLSSSTSPLPPTPPRDG